MEINRLLHKTEDVPKDKKLIVFDLDGTLAESKSPMGAEMAGLLADLLKINMVAIIGGGKYELFQRQLLSKLNIDKELLANLFLFPMTATAFYKYKDSAWTEVYR